MVEEASQAAKSQGGMDEHEVRKWRSWYRDTSVCMLDLTGWPKSMRVILRKERPHPGAQLRIIDVDGHPITCFATNTQGGQLADLELRHRRRAGVEDRVRAARTTGLRNLPLRDAAQNQIWLEIVQVALDLLAGYPCSPWTAPRAAGNPRPAACGCSPPLSVRSPQPAPGTCASMTAGPGPG